MSENQERPGTVPKEAIWNGSENEWELGKKNEQGNHIGEWKWWLAPNGHMCCHSFFDEKGNILSFKRFHPNGEISRYGTYQNGRQIEDVYLKSSEPTSEIFAFGDTDATIFKAVKKAGVPVSFDYYDKEGNHLNPIIEQKNLTEEEPMSNEEIAKLKVAIYSEGKGFLKEQFDSDFYHETIIPMLEDDEQKGILDHIVRKAIENKQDFVFHDGDLHLTNLHSLNEMEIGVMVVHGNLTVDGCIGLIDSPHEFLLVTGNIHTNNVSISGFLFCLGDMTVQNCLMADHNDCSSYIQGALKAKFFYSDYYFFEVQGAIDFTYAFGDPSYINNYENEEAYTWNDRKLSEFIEFLHENIHVAANFKQSPKLLDENCSETGLFEFINRHQLMYYIQENKPVFKD